LRPFTRRVAAFAGILLVGVGLGRFVVPLLEIRSELTALVLTSKGRCSFGTSETTFFLGQERELTDGGILLKCGERRQITKDAFLYCECDP
jgi:hypothetical protein